MSIAPYILETVTPASGLVVSRSEMQAYLRFDDSAEDSLIDSELAAAQDYVQGIIGKQLLTATYDYKLPRFPSPYGPVELPRLPLQSVTSVKYYNTEGTLTTMTVTTEYTTQAGTDHAKGYVLPAYGLCWPQTRGYDRDVVIRFVCGYGLAAAVPDVIKQQIKLIVHHWFYNRGAIACGNQTRAQLAFDALAEFNRHQEFV